VALEASVVNREDRDHSVGEGIAFSESTQVDDGEGRVPVVGVQHHGLPGDPGQELHDSGGEEGEPPVVVRVVRTGLSVDPLPIVILVVFDEEHPGPVRPLARLPETASSIRSPTWS